MAESEEELKSLLMKVKEESGKVGLKLHIQKTKIMASSPITSWEIDGETVETVSNFILLDSKITANGDCSHEIKRCLLLGRKVMIHLDRVFKRSIFSWAPKSLPMVTAAMKLKDTCSLEEKLDSILKSRDITLPTKVRIVKAIFFQWSCIDVRVGPKKG